MSDQRRPLVPGWVWAIVALAAVALTLALLLSDRRPEPGPAIIYDASAYVPVTPEQVCYAETARYALDLNEPSALAVDRMDNLWVAGEKTLLKLDASGKVEARHTIPGTPSCIAVGEDGHVYLGTGTRVVVLGPDATPQAEWEDLGMKAWLTSIAVDPEFAYVVDAGNRVVHQFNRQGVRTGRLGEKDATRSIPGLVMPSPYCDALLDSSGALWVVNPGMHGFEQYRADGSLVSSWYRPGMQVADFCGCCNPIHAAFAPDGTLVTAEKGINRIKAYHPDTSLLGVVAAPEALEGPGGAAAAASAGHDEEAPVRDLAVDSTGRVLVLHGPWRAVVVYEKKP